MESSKPSHLKAELRQQLLKQRLAIDPQVWRVQSDRLCQQLQASPLFAEAKTILAYWSFRQEPDLSALIHAASDRVWGFPRCVGRSLSWHQWSVQSEFPLQTGAYGITEPHPDSPLLDFEQVDLILVPAIACDWRGYRLGYGGGFYDRLLSQPAWAAKPTIGILFESARLPQLPIDPWDQPLHAVCTEAGFFASALAPTVQ